MLREFFNFPSWTGLFVGLVLFCLIFGVLLTAVELVAVWLAPRPENNPSLRPATGAAGRKSS
jgi:hypothetical protein